MSLDQITLKRIHLSYSDRHFHPDRINQETEWYSCAQIAKFMWRVLKDNYEIVTYGDEVPKDKIDLLWTNRLLTKNSNVARMATFASVAHYAFVARQVLKERKLDLHLKPEGSYSIKDRWRHWLTLSHSDLILAIGNETIAKSFSSQEHHDNINIINCGIDSSRFIAPFDANRKIIFIHNATRFSIRKGSHIVADAWKKVSPLLPEAKLLLMGRDGDVDMFEQLRGASKVVFYGEYKSGSSEYVKQLGLSRWVVLPSLAEGQAGTLLEAMSCGCVPIASKATGVDAELYGGYALVPNTVDELAQAMLCAAREWTSEQSRNVRNKTVKYHSWNIFEENILKFTNQILVASPKNNQMKVEIMGKFLLHLLSYSYRRQ